jgi:hypothetical protein
MNDDEAVIGFIAEEGLADPSQVGLGLLVEVDSGPNSSVDEEIIAETAAIHEAFEELDVILWDRSANDSQRLVIAQMRKLFGFDAIALQAFGSAEPAPFRDELGLAAQNSEQHFFVIAEDEDRLNAFALVGA